jgi:hypothetical protein
MARVRRRRSLRAATIHDRRSADRPRNAEIATVEVDDPLALEPGEKIVALRSIRNDPLARLHSRGQIDEAQYQGGRAFQNDSGSGRRRSIPPANMSMACSGARRSPKGSARRCCGSTAPSASLARTDRRWCTMSWSRE